MASGKLLNLSGAEEVRGPLEAVGKEASNTEAQVDVSLFEIQWEKGSKKKKLCQLTKGHLKKRVCPFPLKSSSRAAGSQNEVFGSILDSRFAYV